MLPLLLLLMAADAPLQTAVGQTKGGIPVVAVQGGPWAVVDIHARLTDADLTPSEHRAVDALAAALADGSLALRVRPVSGDVADAGGRVRFRTGPDGLVVSLGAPMERFDVLLRAADELLKGRARVLPATKAVDALAGADDPALDHRALALALPGMPSALPTSGASADPAVLRSAADKIFRRERVALSVVGPSAPSDTLALVLRTMTASLPPSAPVDKKALEPQPLIGGTRLFELEDLGRKGAVATVWLMGPGRGIPGAPAKDRASRAILARLAGGRVEGTEAVFAVALDVDSARAGNIARAEGARVKQILDVARTAPPQELVDGARTQEKAARLARLKDADAVADALGRALLAGDANLVMKELDALDDVTPADVSAAAKAAATGPKIIVRTVGAH
jgi:hypothetical protein